MLGSINDCTEQLVISKFGIDTWHTIKKAAGCHIPDYGFERHGHYDDSVTVSLVVAASQTLGVTVDDVLELFGQYFLEYTIDKGYDNLLRCQGSNLRLWLSNVNAWHDQLKTSLPQANFPVFWCEDCDTHVGSILLHYWSSRGPLLGPVVVGLVKEVALTYFDVEMQMEKFAIQGEEGSECTSWRISAVDESKSWKLTNHDEMDTPDMLAQRATERRCTLPRSNSQAKVVASDEKKSDGKDDGEQQQQQLHWAFTGGGGSAGSAFMGGDFSTGTVSSFGTTVTGCPFTGAGASNGGNTGCRQAAAGASAGSAFMGGALSSLGTSAGTTCSLMARGFEGSGSEGGGSTSLGTSGGLGSISEQQTAPQDAAVPSAFALGLTASRVRSIFPYHVMVDVDFKILQVGRALPGMLMRETNDLIRLTVDQVLKITKPILATWDFASMKKLVDQKFYLAPVPFEDPRTGARVEHTGVKFKGNIVQVSSDKVMFVLSPDAENFLELSQMDLTMSDLPLHSFQRDVVFLGEHIETEVRASHKLDRISKRLEKEKNLSNTLLNSMLPPGVAEQMRAGKTVQPRLYENVTVFFSDVVGFTSICDAVEPWDVIDILNQLYTVMDHLASYFKLYKVETIGDAYMCCSGMPTPDENHAENIANFALAVSECVQHILSPADGEPLQLRIGIHTGTVMGGVVGTLTPHYCLFGDTVNTTSRHESTGKSGKIQCSSVLHDQLLQGFYHFTERGYVDMKGKGRVRTYWLDSGSEQNAHANPDAIDELYMQVGELLAEKKWFKKRYLGFRRQTSLRSARRSSSLGSLFSMDSDLLVEDSLDGSRRSIQDGVDLDDEKDKDNNRLKHMNGESSSTVLSSTAPSLRSTAPDYASDHAVAHSSSETGEAHGNDRAADGDLPGCGIDQERELDHDNWTKIKWDASLQQKDLVAEIHKIMSGLLWKSLPAGLPSNIDRQLLQFIDQTADMYGSHAFHNWDHACHVILSANHLAGQYQRSKEDAGCDPIDSNPWTSFVVVFAALIHDTKHLGVTNEQLEIEQHPLCEEYHKGSYQERRSIQRAFCIFVEDFPELSSAILQSCPLFLHLITSAVLATDISCKETQNKIQERFENVLILADATELERTQVVVEQIMLISDVGHCTQSYDTFLRWNGALFEERLDNYRQKRGDDPCSNWYEDQVGFFSKYILPLADRCDALMSCRCKLKSTTLDNLKKWRDEGEVWTSNIMAQSTAHEKVQEQSSAICN